jgi:(p)ppGpp synthase/HD superfamily hydrolase
MVYTSLTKKAMKIAYVAHKDQIDKSGLPYIFHPFHLAEQMNDEYSTCVALLHDAVEDSQYTIQDLIDNGFPMEVIEAIKTLSHNKGTPYFEYIKNIRNNTLSSRVKIEDLKHNSDLTRLNQITEQDLERIEKYKQALDFLK